MTERIEGTVVLWDARGYGRIRPDHGGYCRAHHTELPGGHGDLVVGERVSFVEVSTPDGWRATSIEFLDRSSPDRATIGEVASARKLDERRRAMQKPACGTREDLIRAGLLRPAEDESNGDNRGAVK